MKLSSEKVINWMSLRRLGRLIIFRPLLQTILQDEDEQGRKPDELSGPSSGKFEGFRRKSEHIPVLEN